MKLEKKMLFPCVLFLVAALLFAVNRIIVSEYYNRERHMRAISFCIKQYYFDHNKMPSSLKEVEDCACGVVSPFKGNLILVGDGNSTTLREKHARFVNLFQKKSIQLKVLPD